MQSIAPVAPPAAVVAAAVPAAVAAVVAAVVAAEVAAEGLAYRGADERLRHGDVVLEAIAQDELEQVLQVGDLGDAVPARGVQLVVRQLPFAGIGADAALVVIGRDPQVIRAYLGEEEEETLPPVGGAVVPRH